MRYADDFVVLAASAPEAERALKDVARPLRGRGLVLNSETTRIVAPGEPIHFLGHALTASANAAAAVEGLRDGAAVLI